MTDAHQFPTHMTIPQAVPYLAARLPGTALAADLTREDDRARVAKIVYRYVADGIIPSLHIGRRVYLVRDQLDAWIASGGKTYAGGWRKNAKESA